LERTLNVWSGKPAERAFMRTYHRFPTQARHFFDIAPGWIRL